MPSCSSKIQTVLKNNKLLFISYYSEEAKCCTGGISKEVPACKRTSSKGDNLKVYNYVRDVVG